MNARISSQIVNHRIVIGAIGLCLTTLSSPAVAQNDAGYYTDPATGIVYRKVTKTIEKPVVETKMEQRQETVYRPQTVTETKPESRTIYSPVVQYQWEPKLHGRWNPFRQPTVAYHHVAKTHWEPRSEVIQRTNTRTEWVAEKRQIEVPQQFVRMERKQQVDFEAVGRVTPQPSGPTGVSEAIASRLRPLDSHSRIEPLGQSRFASSAAAAPRIASNSVGRLTSDPPRRTTGQGGMRATDLYPNQSGVHGHALPPISGGTGVANLPSLPFFR